ncbi:unnamed protein product, partial [Vitis vinifera]|uniref:Uncharacterized protein n=1 Tax=Vitis vinifera TaxID=29760 RepID=D7TCN9_VITVI
MYLKMKVAMWHSFVNNRNVP